MRRDFPIIAQFMRQLKEENLRLERKNATTQYFNSRLRQQYLKEKSP